MRKFLIATALIFIAFWALPGRAWTSGNELDIGGATSVIITGQASMIHLTTSRDAPYKAVLKSQRKGWFAIWYSSWSPDSCQMPGAMKMVGAQLQIDTGSSSWSWFDDSDCRIDITANLPAGSAVSIDQKATMSRLEGDFSSVQVKSHAGDIALEGHARDVDIQGNAIQARLDFDRVDRDETIRIDGNALKADVRFEVSTPVSYTVTGNAALVDSALTNTPGAKPAVTISGNFVHATIR